VKKKAKAPPAREPSPFERFTKIARGIINVPKAEIDAAEERWRAEREEKRRQKEEDDEHAER
jgi:hypothetical protein